MKREGYVQVWVPERLHGELMRQYKDFKKQPRVSYAQGPKWCGLVIIIDDWDNPDGGTIEWNCSGKCSWWDKIRGRKCRHVSGPVGGGMGSYCDCR